MNTKNLKPFNLKAALRGKPVMLRDGTKAYVRHHETEVMIGGGWQIWGVAIGRPSLIMWKNNGGYDMDDYVSDLDIIGMWTEPRIARVINGFEVPAPETIAPSKYYIPALFNKGLYSYSEWTGSEFDIQALKRGLVFLNKEDAIANAKAMLGIDPYEESE